MKKTKTLVSAKRTKTPPKKAEILEEELPLKTPTSRKKTPKASRKTSTKKTEILEEEILKTPNVSRKTPLKTPKITEEEIPKTPKASRKIPPKTPEISKKEYSKTSKKTPKSSLPPEPIQENNKIGIDNINVLFDSLLKISVKDILASNENPDMMTPFNSILAIS